MPLLGRSVPTAGKNDAAMKKAMADHNARSKEDPRAQRSSIANLATSKGDHTEVAEAVLSDDPHHEGHLNSFLPAQLRCLDKFLPSLAFQKGPRHDELLGIAGAAPTTAQNVVSELHRLHTEGPNGLHFLAFLAGILLIVGAIMNVVVHVLKLSPLHTFFALMMFVFGMTTLVLEQQRAVFPPYVRAWIEHNFLFLTLITGRGAFYIYVGAIQAAVNWQGSPFNTLVGLYVLFVGGVYIQTGLSVNTKLHQLQHSLQSPEVIKQAFAKADVDNSGALDLKELSLLMGVLGSTMTEKEAETALLMLDKDDSGTVSLEEFLIFMERGDSKGMF